jgi:2-hydroxychromene-2-carboxylate isomerase
MTLAVDVFWSFRSPYSYLATGRLVELEKRYDLEVRVRPVLPLAVREPDFFQKVNPLWPPYLMRDTVRVAECHGIDYHWPRPDPVVQALEDGKLVTAPEQPYIHRLTRLGMLAVERGRGLPFIDEVSRLIWSGEVEGWQEGTHLADATARAGLDLAELDATAEREADRLDAAIAQNQEDLETAGHWGVPTMVFEGEPFFGQDRIDLLTWRMKQRGLRSR